MKFIYELQRTL